MWNEILNDLWRVYRGRLLGSVFGEDLLEWLDRLLPPGYHK